MNAVSSNWRLKLPALRLYTQSFIQAQIKENIKAPRHWPLWGEFTGDRWIPAQMASNAENVSICLRHHAMVVVLLSSFLLTKEQCYVWMIFVSHPLAYIRLCIYRDLQHNTVHAALRLRAGV